MESGEPRRDGANLRDAHFAAGHHPIEHRGLADPTHPDRPLDHRIRFRRADSLRAQR